MTNKETFAATYAAAFVDSYPELTADKSKRLGIKCTYKAIEEYVA